MLSSWKVLWGYAWHTWVTSEMAKFKLTYYFNLLPAFSLYDLIPWFLQNKLFLTLFACFVRVSRKKIVKASFDRKLSSVPVFCDIVLSWAYEVKIYNIILKNIIFHLKCKYMVHNVLLFTLIKTSKNNFFYWDNVIENHCHCTTKAFNRKLRTYQHKWLFQALSL